MVNKIGWQDWTARLQPIMQIEGFASGQDGQG